MPEVYVMTVWLITFIRLENKVCCEVVKVVFGVEIATKDRFGILEHFDVLLVLDHQRLGICLHMFCELNRLTGI